MNTSQARVENFQQTELIMLLECTHTCMHDVGVFREGGGLGNQFRGKQIAQLVVKAQRI